jgi:hypothetical protein
VNSIFILLVDNILPVSRAEEDRLLVLNIAVSLLAILFFFTNQAIIATLPGLVLVGLLGTVAISSICLRLLT